MEYIIKVYKNKVEYYNLDRELHREDGPAVECSGYKSWYINGQRHREDGPAIEYENGSESWWKNGQRHRGDGPAYNVVNNINWYIDGVKYNKKQFLDYTLSKIFAPQIAINTRETFERNLGKILTKQFEKSEKIRRELEWIEDDDEKIKMLRNYELYFTECGKMMNYKRIRDQYFTKVFKTATYKLIQDNNDLMPRWVSHKTSIYDQLDAMDSEELKDIVSYIIDKL